MNGPQRYNFEQLREQINSSLLSENMTTKLYESTNGIMKIIEAIVKTRGENWAVQVLNNDGNPVLTPQEQQQFTEAFQPYVESIIDFFGQPTDMDGGFYPGSNLVEKLSGMAQNNLKTKIGQATGQVIPESDVLSINNTYSKIVKKVDNINNTVNGYASKYGILKLEKEHDLEPDVRLIPQPAAIAISDGIFSLSTLIGFPIPPTMTMEVLSKVKVPFRLIVFVLYLILDIARIVISVEGPPFGRKILSIVLTISDLLKGDWKKAVLSFIGYYGTTPLLIGELLKIFLSLFRKLSPEIQHSIIFGSLDAGKSFIIGILLAIFQVTAPEEIRLPIIGALEKVAKRKAEMDGVLIEVGLSARPDYLAPSWEDLNNIQAVMTDEAYVCSCEFQDLVKSVEKSAIIRMILEILRIPVNKDMIEYKCGKEPCKDFVTSVVKDAKDDTEKQNVNENPSEENIAEEEGNPAEAEVTPAKPEENIAEEEVKPTETEVKPTETEVKPTETEVKPTKPEVKPTETEVKPTETEVKPTETEVKPTKPEVKPTETEVKPTETEVKTGESENPTPLATKGGRILHSRKNYKKIQA
jgi:hypothetical protein